MTTSLVAMAIGMAILCWPISSVDQHRLRRLAEAGRLGRVTKSADPRPRLRARNWPGRMLPGPTVALAVAAVIGVATGARYGGGLGVAAALIPAVAWRLLRARALRRSRAIRARALNAALGLACAELAAGTRIDHALQAAAEAAGPFEAAFGAAARAVGEASDPVAAVVTADTAAELRPMVAALQIAMRSGAPIAAVLDRARSDVAERAALARDLAAAVSGARASAALLAVLPALGVAMGVGLGAAPLRVLFGTSAGHGLLATGAVLTALGLLWTERLISAAERPP